MADDYTLIDVGDGARLERFGSVTVERPHAAAMEHRRDPKAWRHDGIRFDATTGWSGLGLPAVRDGWSVSYRSLSMELRPTPAGQVGLFPEHGELVPWLCDRVVERRRADGPVEVLNLFAYTGLVTLAMAREGAAVTHVDASRPAVAWARRNAGRNGLTDRPIRWIVDDARTYVAREDRRGRRYDGIVLDPPTYGHGASGRAWVIDRDLPALIDGCRSVLRPDGFLLLTAHADGLTGADLLGALDAPAGAASGARTLSGGRTITGATSLAGDLTIEADSGAIIDAGVYATFDGWMTG